MADPLVDFATVQPVPLHGAVLGARAPLARMVTDLLAVPDRALDGAWRWRTTDREDLDVRYAFFRIHERLEAAIGAIEVGRGSGGTSIGPAVPALAAMAAARWELHGVLAALDAATWDAGPGGGEWTIRQTLGHIIGSQRSYGWYNAWYLRQGVVGREVDRPSDDEFPPEPTEEEEAAGPPEAVRARLDEIVDANAVAVAGLDHAAMGVSARWWVVPVTVDFRLGRYGSHIREHTVQVDKTLVLLGRQPTEVGRLVRLILATYGRLEAQLIGRPPAVLEWSLSAGPNAIRILQDAVDDAEAIAASVRKASAG